MPTGCSPVDHTTVERVQGEAFGSARDLGAKMFTLGSTWCDVVVVVVAAVVVVVANGQWQWQYNHVEAVGVKECRRQRPKGGRGNVVTSNVHVNNFSKTQ